jgi:hypothetical protein
MKDSSALAHMFFFELTDKSDELADQFIQLCWDYLSGYDGQIFFNVGRRALSHDFFKRRVSALNFDVSVHMIFSDLDSYKAYRKHKRHDDFITEVAGMSTGRIVYDSFIAEASASKKKKGGLRAKQP